MTKITAAKEEEKLLIGIKEVSKNFSQKRWKSDANFYYKIFKLNLFFFDLKHPFHIVPCGNQGYLTLNLIEFIFL